VSDNTRRTRENDDAEHGNIVPANISLEETSRVVPLKEEYLEVNKTWVQAGEVIIRKEVQEVPQTIPADLAHDEVSVERVAVNRYFEAGQRPEQRQEGDTLIIPLVEEQLVVVKRYFVREEVRITRRRAVTRKELSDTVRRERLVIESSGRLEAGNSPNLEGEPGRA